MIKIRMVSMETMELFSTFAEYEKWLAANKDKAQEYIKKNDVNFKNVQISTRAYNVLRINGLNYMSDIVFLSAEEINNLEMMNKTAADEILMFKRNYLRKHKNNLVSHICQEASDDKKEKEKSESNDIKNEIYETNAEDTAKIRSKLCIGSIKNKFFSYFKFENKLPIETLNLPTRVENLLKNRGITHIYKLIRLYPNEIIRFKGMSKSMSDKACVSLESFLQSRWSEVFDISMDDVEEVAVIDVESNTSFESTSFNNSLHYIKTILSDTSTKEKIIEFTKPQNVEIEDLGISVRSYNALRRGNVRYFHEAISYYPDDFVSFRNMGAKSIDEICSIIENYVSKHYDQITAYIRGEGGTLEGPLKICEEAASEERVNINIEQETDPFKLTILQLLMHPTYKEKAKKYLLENNIPVEQMGLSVRSVNAFMRSNILSFYDALSVYPDNLSSLRNIGAKSIDEIKTRMEYYISKMQNAVSAYCSGDMSAMYSDEFVFDTVMSCFEDIGFKGISFKQIRDVFPDEFDETRIKQCIGGLLADKKLEYVDFRLYRVYPSVYSVIEQSSLEYEEKDILRKKLDGMTLEAIAQEYGVTRERIRQKFEKNFKKLRAQLQTNYGFFIFDEDYYAYLYSNYEVIKEMWLDFLGVPGKIFSYLVNSHAKGKKQISEALSDPKIDLILKFKIQDYLNRNKILIDGQLIERQRSDIEDYALSKVARDELSYDEFAERYNELLQQNGIDFDERLYYTDEVRRTRSNRLSDSMYCLWKQGEKLRYYDIAGRDYGELLETISLESFVDIEISTLKFFNDYPDVMAKYDIRDQYELHNLLKKVVDCSKYNDMSIHRQPMIQFGTFDRTQALYDLIVAFSPITSDELAEYVFSEYGYDKATAQATYFQPLSKYFHQGVYSVEFKRIPYDRIETLKAELPEEFYYISEIKALYKKLFENADLEEINPRSLKALGYTVFTSYVLKTYSTSDAYFRDVLNAKDVFSLKELNKKYGNLGAYTSALYDMRRNYDILIFEEGQCINFRRIEKLGITKDDIKKYCDEVYNLIDENQYFTIHSLQELEITTKLESLGFDEIFLAGILAMSTRFLYTQIFGNLVLYKGEGVSGISKKSFILSLLSNYDDVDIDQFKDDCLDIFGIKIPDRYEITNAIADTNYYYDEIMDKVYRNKNVYYSEFED